MLRAIQHQSCEWSLHASGTYGHPADGIELDVALEHEDGARLRVPAFWAGGDEWRVRVAAPRPGRWRFASACSRTDDRGLHDARGELDVAPADGDNPLLRRGPLRVAASGRHLEHADGTPFLWLGDTWWLGCSARLRWPDEFRSLAAERAAQGFSVVQIVAGLYPEIAVADAQGRNEAGSAWEADLARPSRAWFDAVDQRIGALVEAGIVPCVFAAWGFHVVKLGRERMRRHWREIIARWAAHPVVWCVAGEATTPCDTPSPERDRAEQRDAWTAIAAYVRATDGHRRPITIHPPGRRNGRDELADPALADVEMLQGGHRGWIELEPTLRQTADAVRTAGGRPVVMGEMCYEGLLETNRQEIQRIAFWGTMLAGAAGFTYGANGIWQMNRPGDPFGPSFHGGSYGDVTWRDASRLPGAAHVAVGRRILERFAWWRFTPRPDWVGDRAADDGPIRPLAAGIPGEVRVLYFPDPTPPWVPIPREVRGLERGARYRATFFDPKDGRGFDAGEIAGDEAGTWPVRFPSLIQDWVLALVRI